MSEWVQRPSGLIVPKSVDEEERRRFEELCPSIPNVFGTWADLWRCVSPIDFSGHEIPPFFRQELFGEFVGSKTTQAESAWDTRNMAELLDEARGLIA